MSVIGVGVLVPPLHIVRYSFIDVILPRDVLSISLIHLFFFLFATNKRVVLKMYDNRAGRRWQKH